MTVNASFWIAIAVAALGLAYVTQFAGATLSFGRRLSDSESGTGFQDAVTPPWQSNLALFIYLSAIAVVGVSWFFLGTGKGLLSLVSILVGAMILRRLVPSADSKHFERLIVRSMAVRYANYKRDGDSERANAMEMLLRRAGIDPSGQRDA